MLSELTVTLISLLSFLLPTQLGLHLNNLSPTVYGFKIDYLTPTIYLTDIVILPIIVYSLRKLKFSKRQILFSLLYIGFALINILTSSYQLAAVYKWLRISEMILLGLALMNTKKFDSFKHFFKPLSYSMIIVCLLGIFQFLTKGSIGGIFYWLGERSFLFSDPNVSPYPYSTFSHPNSFAGFLLIFGIFLLKFKKRLSSRFFWLLSTLVIVNLILTNSLNVYVSIVILILLKSFKIYSFPFFIIDFSQRSISHRVELIGASFKMIKENWLSGVGLNNFIPNLPQVTKTFLNAWELQPVHNIFLLIFSETGILGLGIFCYLIFSVTMSSELIAILLTGMPDHYWLTLQQNLLLFTYVLSLSKRGKK